MASELTPDGAVEHLQSAFAADEAMRGLFLGGSHGRGTADEWSDLDFVAVAQEPDFAALAERWLAAIRTRAEIVHTMQRRQGPTLLLNVVTAEWLRIDLLLLVLTAFGWNRARDGLRVLFDRDDAAAALPATLPPRRPDPTRVRHIVTEFLRVLGLVPVAAGREEWFLTASGGTGHLRSFAQDLLVECSPVADRGGALGLARVLPDDDRAWLASLPFPQPERESVIAAHAALARAFLPRARAAYAQAGLEWPQAFEDATRRRLRATLGTEAADW